MNLADSPARTTSQANAILAPAPAATPFTAQTTGKFNDRINRRGFRVAGGGNVVRAGAGSIRGVGPGCRDGRSRGRGGRPRCGVARRSGISGWILGHARGQQEPRNGEDHQSAGRTRRAGRRESHSSTMTARGGGLLSSRGGEEGSSTGIAWTPGGNSARPPVSATAGAGFRSGAGR